ncbi:hypothetical protein K402DRAFT_422040 [Aulographum hederae CBS 113979]|uniref:Uncharacterized protein n=1 Tax=Aulographum hederae CBS 113979 TaxID=1176131 RepID=A0A6G1GXC6_9PEZI|nr:hypothetical protein K402DRAFT_422040 [Aulographum hederae CBS 113979]
MSSPIPVLGRWTVWLSLALHCFAISIPPGNYSFANPTGTGTIDNGTASLSEEWDVGTTVYGSVAAASCFSAQNAFVRSSDSWYNSIITASNLIITTGSHSETATWRIPLGIADTSIGCDGFPRITRGSLTVTGFSITTTIPTIFDEETLLPTELVPYSSPNCIIAPEDCDTMYNSFSHIPPSAKSWSLFQTSSFLDCSPSEGYCGQCTLEAGLFDIFFWPPDVTSVDLCGNSGSGMFYTSPPPIATAPVTAVVDKITLASTYIDPDQEYLLGNGSWTPSSEVVAVITGPFTFTSPSVYIAYHNIRATDLCGTVGNVHSTGVVGMPPEDVSSVVPHFPHDTRNAIDRASWLANTGFYVPNMFKEEPVNYAHFVGPVPGIAYYGLTFRGFLGARTVITQEAYFPSIAIPKAMRALDPAWKDCAPAMIGVPDPPRTLKAQSDLVLTTTKSSTKASATPPSPASSVVDARPTQTAKGTSGQNGGKNVEGGGNSGGSKGDSGNNPGSSNQGSSNGNPDGGSTDPSSNSGTDSPGDPESNPGSSIQGSSNGNPDGERHDPTFNSGINSLGDQQPENEPSDSDPSQNQNNDAPDTRPNSPAPAPIPVGGTSTISLPSPPAMTLSPIATVAGQDVYVDPSNADRVIVGGQGIERGEDVMVGGERVYFGPEGLVVGGSSTIAIAVAIPTPHADSGLQKAVLTLGSEAVTATMSNGAVAVGSVTLDAGHPTATIGGEVVSLSPDGSLVVDGTTVTFSSFTGDDTEAAKVVGAGAYIASAIGYILDDSAVATNALSATGPGSGSASLRPVRRRI